VPYYVYVLLCENGSYYTGCAKDIDLRVKQHERGDGARRRTPPEKLRMFGTVTTIILI
jgi:putative endonuclease